MEWQVQASGEKRWALYIYVDHTINSARGQERRGCKVGGRVLNLWCDLHIYFKTHLFSPDANCTCHPYI